MGLENFKTTARVKTIEYAIRDLIGCARQIAKTGKEIYYLNIGDPVAYDFKTPAHIKQAFIEAIEEGLNSYSPSEGLMELRQAIAEKEGRSGIDISADDVMITSGISEGIQMVIAAILEKGDEILIPGPSYPPYISYAKLFEGKPVTYETLEDEGWQPSIEDLRSKISKRTRAMLIINPNNPTGALYENKILKQMLDVAGEYNLLVLSDEIYDQIRYKENFVSTAQLAKDVPLVVLNGFSKVYLMTGWRLGYLYYYDRSGRLTELKHNIEKEGRIRICVNTPVQKAGIAALTGPQDHVKDLVERLKQRRDYAWNRLSEISGISCEKPEGAFYLFPRIQEIGSKWRTDKDFVLDLLKETGVLIVHGSGFDPVYGAGHVRMVFLPTIEVLEKALSEVERFITKNSRKTR